VNAIWEVLGILVNGSVEIKGQELNLRGPRNHWEGRK
jgi:hypothetical protein